MNIAFVGFGRMGSNLALQILEKGHSVLAYDIDPSIKENFINEPLFKGENFKWFEDSNIFFKSIKPGDIVFVFVPHGEITNQVLAQLINNLPPGTFVLEGGNSNYKEAIFWNEKFEKSEINFFDVGTSGGIQGARFGLCAMIGGNLEQYKIIEPFLQSICAEKGLLHTGPAGSGHFLKMVHNGIEYGMMQSIAEGFDVLENSGYSYDFEKVSTLWNEGSVIRSWLMELLIDVFNEDPELKTLKGKMEASGEAQWFVEEAMNLKTPVPVIALSLMMRNRSLTDDTFSGKIVSALRKSFGGHAVERV